MGDDGGEDSFEDDAKKRQAHGQTAPGKTLRADWSEANETDKGRARDKAAELVGASPQSGVRGILLLQGSP